MFKLGEGNISIKDGRNICTSKNLHRIHVLDCVGMFISLYIYIHNMCCGMIIKQDQWP